MLPPAFLGATFSSGHWCSAGDMRKHKGTLRDLRREWLHLNKLHICFSQPSHWNKIMTSYVSACCGNVGIGTQFVIWHFYNTCHVRITLFIYIYKDYMTFTLWGRRDGNGWVRRLPSERSLLKICEHETTGYFWQDILTISSHISGNVSG